MNAENIRPAEYETEKRDCTIRAFVLVTEIPYQEVHNYFKDKGRENGKGFHIQTTRLKRSRRRVKKVKIPLLAKHFGYTAVQVARSGTANKLIKRYPQGKIYCVKPRHCFAIIDGIIKDDTSYNSRIYNAWLIFKEAQQ